jgi:hypothetical protein
MQHTLVLVKSHHPEADLDPVGDGVPADCSEADWEANHAAVLGIAERIVADMQAAGFQDFLLFILLQKELFRVDRLKTIVMQIMFIFNHFWIMPTFRVLSEFAE